MENVIFCEVREVKPGTPQTSKTESFATIVNGFCVRWHYTYDQFLFQKHKDFNVHDYINLTYYTRARISFFCVVKTKPFISLRPVSSMLTFPLRYNFPPLSMRITSWIVKKKLAYAEKVVRKKLNSRRIFRPPRAFSNKSLIFDQSN